jgi:hypothetical protein
VSRTTQQNFVNGVNRLIDQNLKLIGDPDSLNLMARNRGITPAQLTEQLLAKNAELADRMIETGQMGGEEFDALVMSQDNVVENTQNYYAGAKIMGGMVDIVGQASPELLDWMELAARGAEVEESAGVAVPGGLTRRTGVSEKVTPDVLMGATKLLFGVDPTSGPRSPDHHLSKKNPRSYHNTLNGGRAIDVAPIKGMTFDQYVSRWKAAGFDVVEAINETGSGKTAHATGDHWHIAFGNQREVVEDKPAEGNVPYTRDDFNMLDPRHKQTLLGMINDRRQVLREAEAERRAQAREDERAAREAANTQRIIDNAVGLENAGAGGDWDGETRGVKDRMFRATFDPANFGNEQTRGQIIQWVQRENFVPPSLIQYVTNGIRSEDWTGALGLYQSLSEASTGRGANIGDLFVEQFDDRTASLLMEADRLSRSGQTKQIGPRLERLRSGDGFTKAEAQAAYSASGGGGERQYVKDRNDRLREAFGYDEDVVLDPRLVKDFDAAFASNLDIANRDGSKAMDYAVRQMRGRVAKSDIFTGGVGPGVLTRNYSNQQLYDFFTKETRADTGGPLVPKVKGGHRMGRDRSTIQLAPLDSQTRTVGRYMVIVRNPENLTQVIDSFEIDLGKELREYYTKQGKGAQVNPIDEARRKRTATEQSLIDFGKRSDRGPKY